MRWDPTRPESYSDWLTRVKRPEPPLPSGWINETTPRVAEPGGEFWAVLVMVSVIVLLFLFWGA